jgi:pimeloyl-ACP methyl ester carboxylesterase
MELVHPTLITPWPGRGLDICSYDSRNLVFAMRSQPTGFPAVFGVIAAQKAFLSPAAFGTLRDVFKKLADGSPFGAIGVHSESGELARAIAESAEGAGVNCHEIETARSSTKEGFSAAEMELVEASDLLLLISRAESPDAHSFQTDFIAYARNSGRSIIRLDPVTGGLDGDIPRQIEVDQGWLPELFEMAGLPADADLETIKSKMSALANKSAPTARAGGHWMVFLQGLAVCLPLAWLTQRVLGLPSLGIAGAGTFSVTLLLMTAIWWLRWRGMQKTWARSRLVAEVTRSLLAAADCPGTPTWRSLSLVPSLRPLRWLATPARKSAPFAEWRDAYIKNRITGQAEYFRKKQEEAQKLRKKFSRWTTIVLDLVLAIAFSGAAVAFFGQRWLEESGGDYLQVFFGVGGVAFAASLVLIQLLRNFQDLNRHTARFAQQQQFLEQARVRLASVQSEEAATEVVEDTESELLAEVLEWYFHAETAEQFVRVSDAENKSHVSTPFRTTERGLAGRLIGRVAVGTGTAGLFALQVIFGRMPWILASVAAAIIWIGYNAGGQAPDFHRFEKTVHLSSPSQSEFAPKPEETARGCAVLVHGLYGGAVLDSGADAWIKTCATEIENRMIGEGIGKPAICLVDWKAAARPSRFFQLGFGERMLLADLAAIRPQAYRVGDYSAIQIAKFMNEGKIDRNKPLHLIGHSAGGFVVARVATRLSEMGFVRNKGLLRVTILDTPVPDDPLVRELPKLWPTDYCVTSARVMKAPFDAVKEVADLDLHIKSPDYEEILTELRQRPKPVVGFWPSVGHWLWGWTSDFWQAHSSAYGWFELTIKKNPKYDTEGFNRSPLLKQKTTATPP